MAIGEQQVRVMRTLWAAILGASVLFAAMPHLLPPAPASQLPAMFPAVLAVLAIAITWVSFWLPAQQARRAFEPYRERVKEEVAATEDAGYRAENRRRRVLTLGREELQRVFMVSQTGLILSVAMGEAVSLFGLVLDRVGFPMTASGPFFAAGSLLIALRFPSLAAIVGRVARVVDAEVVLDA